MTRRILRRCLHPGCTAMVPKGRCSQHETTQQRQDRAARGSSTQRGYDARWRRVRKAKLARNPLCEPCEAEGRTRAGDMVHHVVPIAEGGERLAMGNLQTCCWECHARIHAELP